MKSMVEMNVATGKGSLVLTVNLLLLQKNYSFLDQPYEKTYLQSWYLNLPAFLVLYLDLEESRCLVKAYCYAAGVKQFWLWLLVEVLLGDGDEATLELYVVQASG